MNISSILSKSGLILFSLVFLTGCPPKKKLAIEEKPKEVAEEKTEDAEAAKDTANAAENIQIQQDWTEIPALQPVQFAYDSAAIDDGARATLKTNVAILKKLPKTVTVRVEGHCDDRGTVEYNIALGQRRADALKNYYATSGIARSRLDSISFGEERPICNEMTEGCWAKNRRGATKVKNSASPITIKPTDLK